MMIVVWRAVELAGYDTGLAGGWLLMIGVIWVGKGVGEKQ